MVKCCLKDDNSESLNAQWSAGNETGDTVSPQRKTLSDLFE
jgi:hypothetical protein